MKLKKHKIKLIALSVFLIFISVIYIYSGLKYQYGYNITITNSSENEIDNIEFFFGLDNNKIKINSLKPDEEFVLKGKLNGTGENLYAQMPTLKSENEVIPLAYIYSETYVNVVKINITDVSEDKKVRHIEFKSFNNYPSVVPPWQIGILYDYATVTY